MLHFAKHFPFHKHCDVTKILLYLFGQHIIISLSTVIHYYDSIGM